MRSLYQVLVLGRDNTCRSPMAEIILRHRFEATGIGDRVVVESAGTRAEHVGDPIDPRAVAVLAAHGYPAPLRRARRLRGDAELSARDLVLVMTEADEASLRRRTADAGPAGRVRLLRSFDPSAPVVTPEEWAEVMRGPDNPAERWEPAMPAPRRDIGDLLYLPPAFFEDCLVHVEGAADGIVEHVRGRLDPPRTPAA